MVPESSHIKAQVLAVESRNDISTVAVCRGKHFGKERVTFGSLGEASRILTRRGIGNVHVFGSVIVKSNVGITGLVTGSNIAQNAFSRKRTVVRMGHIVKARATSRLAALVQKQEVLMQVMVGMGREVELIPDVEIIVRVSHNLEFISVAITNTKIDAAIKMRT